MTQSAPTEAPQQSATPSEGSSLLSVHADTSPSVAINADASHILQSLDGCNGSSGGSSGSDGLLGTSIYSDFECRGERRRCKVLF